MNDTTVVAAVLGLLGVLATAAVTFVGLLLKRSFDSHSLRLQKAAEKRLTIESVRNQALQKEAEDRLRMETAIRAVGLMSTSSGVESAQSQQAGALFALASLGQLEFALALLSQMWPAERIDSISAVWLINRAFMSKNTDVQETAAASLSSNATLIGVGGGWVWPTCLDTDWRLELSVEARETVLDALLNLILSRPVGEWNQEYLNHIFLLLYLIMASEKEPRIRIGSALALDVLLPLFIEGPQVGIYTPSGVLNFIELEPEVSAVLQERDSEDFDVDASVQVYEAIELLKKWAG